MPSFSAAGDQALNQLNRLPFDNIIGGPLNAAIKAQAQAAETTVDFIQSVGMEEVNGRMQAINVQFSYQDSAGLTRRITVPILAIVPIPFIVIDSVGISFKAKITASASEQASQSISQSGYVRGYAGYSGRRFRAALSAGYSAKKDSKASQESKYSVEYTMDVDVHASQAGLPAGMEAVLGFLQQGTHELPNVGKITVLGLPQVVSPDATSGTLTEFNIVVTDERDRPVEVAAGAITVESVNDFIDGQVTEGPGTTANDGIFGIVLKKGSAPFPDSATEVVDDIEITVNLPGEEPLVTSRPLTVQV